MDKLICQTIKERIAVLILGGGRGTRLYPLTLKRCKPAVPFAGRYRLVDISLSRCIHAGLLNLYVLTQYNSASLHLHINRTYRFDTFTKGDIQILAANQSHMQNDMEQWFLGSADAVRKSLDYCSYGDKSYKHYLILAGDQIHEMDMEAMLIHHLEQNSDFTIAATPIGSKQLDKYGILKSDASGQVRDFLEKPQQDQPEFNSGAAPDKPYWGSMGSYLIKANILKDILNKGSHDFGSGVIPYAAKHYKMLLYPHLGFFEDIGFFETFFNVHIALVEARLPINLYHPSTNLFTYRRELPPAVFNGNTDINKSMVVEGSVLDNNIKLHSSLIGVRSIIQKNCTLHKAYVMGNDFYHKDFNIGIGANCQIANAIIDKNAYIGPGCRIGLEPEKLRDGDYQDYSVRNGIVIIPKSGRLSANTVI